MSKNRWLLIALISLGPLRPAAAFNLITDIRQNTQWTLGNVAAAGTSINLRNGQYDASEFAQIASYRFLSAWYGGIEVPQGDNTVKLTDSFKIGLNLSYFGQYFTNKPPALLNNLVIGPAASYNIATTPRVFTPFVDINYQFGGVIPTPNATTPTATPTVPLTSKLNVSPAGSIVMLQNVAY